MKDLDKGLAESKGKNLVTENDSDQSTIKDIKQQIQALENEKGN